MADQLGKGNFTTADPFYTKGIADTIQQLPGDPTLHYWKPLSTSTWGNIVGVVMVQTQSYLELYFWMKLDCI